MKNLIHTLVTFLIVSLMLNSCGNKEAKLTILGENSSTLQSMQTLQQEYEDKSGVKLDFKPNSFEDAFNRSNQDFANKTGLYDIVLQYNFSLSSFVRNDYVQKLDDLKKESPNTNYDFEKDIFPNVWKEVGFYYKDPANPNDEELEIIFYPFAANTMLLVYNQELFNDSEQKKNFQEMYGRELTVPTDMQSFKQLLTLTNQVYN